MSKIFRTVFAENTLKAFQNGTDRWNLMTLHCHSPMKICIITSKLNSWARELSWIGIARLCWNSFSEIPYEMQLTTAENLSTWLKWWNWGHTGKVGPGTWDIYKWDLPKWDLGPGTPKYLSETRDFQFSVVLNRLFYTLYFTLHFLQNFALICL